ncbi:hypothetical protein DICVIV_08861 [Dictyocaulus viviparus]|uniref:Uncharacterized protein n=1 Tax=Dictyocaulus viviparus TaxID=29172 RepID=A0A0D8XMS4_DICVI|nr:hypothetical protein DICVIV_08861 [Dictyocaulus viviparus]
MTSTEKQLNNLISEATKQKTSSNKLLAVKILSNGADQQELLLCQLSESSTLLAQLGILVSEGLDRLMQNQGIAVDDSNEVDETGVEKRKHEYLRFGKRKHEYLRFGKRKHEYLSRIFSHMQIDEGIVEVESYQYRHYAFQTEMNKQITVKDNYSYMMCPEFKSFKGQGYNN